MPEQAEQPTQEQPPEPEQDTTNIAAKPPTLSINGKLRQREQKQNHQPQDYEGDYPPPQRACICCGAYAWQWAGEKYICSSPDHPEEI